MPAARRADTAQQHVGEAAALQAKDRLEFLLDCWNAGIPDHTPEYRAELIRSLTFYFDYELNRNDFRWIASAFHMPGLAIKAYFTFFDDMESRKSYCKDSERELAAAYAAFYANSIVSSTPFSR